jgi:hypothetical protein
MTENKSWTNRIIIYLSYLLYLDTPLEIYNNGTIDAKPPCAVTKSREDDKFPSV